MAYRVRRTAVLEDQVIADMLMGGHAMLGDLQDRGGDRDAEYQMSGAISALAIVLGVEVSEFIGDDATCEAIKATFETMRQIGAEKRIAAIGAN